MAVVLIQSGRARVKSGKRHWLWGASLFGCAAVIFSGEVRAQDVGSLLGEQWRLQERQRLESLPKPEEVAPGSAQLPAPEQGETIIVRQLRFSAKVGLLSEADRARFSASVKDKRLGLTGLYALAGKVTASLQQQGHLLARAILPPQDITEGIVTIEIIEGTLEGITFEHGQNVRANEDRLRMIAESHLVAESVTKQDLEEALLRMNDHPGVTARAKLTPGTAANTSLLIVDVEQAPIFSASFWGDNAGSSSTGRAQGNALVTITDLTGHGDLTRLTGTFSEGQKFGQAASSMPLSTSKFTVNANYNYLQYRNVDDLGTALDLKGYAHSAGIGLDYGLINGRDFNLLVTGGLNWKALVDESLIGRLQDKRVIATQVGMNGDMRDHAFGSGLTSWSLGWTYGDLDLSREPTALAADQTGLQTQGQFHRLNASLARLQDLPRDFSLFGRVYGQWASKNLDSSEDFSLGGPYGVRGWPVGEGRGDMGLLGTIELRYEAPIPEPFGALQLAAFLDGGHVWVNKSPDGIATTNACACNDYDLASAGLSARWTRENLSFSATWAHGLGDNPGRSSITGENAGGGTSNQQFWFSGAIKF
ncbi:ShlB/FhaC/HecB family hemolysin secretion/activation protein [Devosia sp.]|uniref:ShlB/FhaC/HecB family hemolysin secretion/activation protein n=1 Tax=Devosia sp. TaxID=1871048 RepID=UPI002FC70DA4